MDEKSIINIILKHFADVEAIYLFGSISANELHNDSDVDIALLLPEQTAKKAELLLMNQLSCELQIFFKREVDLVNLRKVSTVFQKEVIATGNCIYCSDKYETDKFEMLTLSYYQKLNEERKEILEQFFKTKRAYAV